jgi:Zn-dependent M28 family amino/carboxypeptidase
MQNHDPLLAEALQRHVSVLALDIGERNVFRPGTLDSAADYIRSQWISQGYTVFSQAYETMGVTCQNLEVARPGQDDTEGMVVIGAHYDTERGSPGADDNASGIAALLEISRFFAARSPRCAVRFVAFVNEEAPFFYWRSMGSMVYARAARARGDGIRWMVSLEMLGCFRDEPGSQRYPPLLKRYYPERGNFIAFVSNLKSRKVLRRVVAAFRGHSDFPAESLAACQFVPGVAWSDQQSFWRQGYPALMVTDTAFYRYPHYHTAYDTPEKLDYVAMSRVVRGLNEAFAALTR